MTVTTSGSVFSYNGDGSTVNFAFPRRYNAVVDVKVFLLETDGVTLTPKTLATHYNVTEDPEPENGLTVVWNFPTHPKPAAGEKVVIYRDTPETQSAINLAVGGAFGVESHETALDVLTMIADEAREDLNRAMFIDRWDAHGAGEFDARSNKIKNLEDGVADQDAASVGQINALTGAAVAATAADAIATAADAVSTGIDAAATAADAIATAADAASTAADAASTAADVTATGIDATATAADAVQTALDVIATAADAASTAADAIATAADAAATAADAVQTALDAIDTGADAVSTAADVVSTGIDATATAADLVLTNADVVLTGVDAAAAAVSAANAAAASQASSFTWKFDDGTADADPGSGNVRLNNAVFASVTKIFLSETAQEGAVDAFLSIWDDSTSAQKAYIRIIDPVTPANWAVYQLDATIVDDGVYRDLTVTHVASGGSLWADERLLVVEWQRTGDAGSAGVDSFNGRTGVVVSVSGDYDASEITETAGAKIMTSTERTKLGLIEGSATADQTDAEIETAYNSQVGVVSQVDAEAGTSTTPERWTAQRVAQAIAALESGGGSGFDAGTRMIFHQTAAPTGWTKDTTAGLNDNALRIVTGSVSPGGTDNFSTAFSSSKATDSHTLAESEMPAHTHDIITIDGGTEGVTGAWLELTDTRSAKTTTSTGGGGGHTHTIVMDPKFQDFIIASKDA